MMDLKLALLERFAAERRSQHRGNVLGRPMQRGVLEFRMGVEFSVEERAAAHQALRELEADGLVRATHADTVSPFDWLEITDAGRRAVELNALDALDHRLRAIDPQLIELRRGAWAASHSNQPDAVRQAAHSGRELIRQTLDRSAPDEEVRRTLWFQGDQVRRRDRVKCALEKARGNASESTLRVIEAQCDVVEANYQRLSAVAHADTPVAREHVRELLRAAEAALKDILGE